MFGILSENMQDSVNEAFKAGHGNKTGLSEKGRLRNRKDGSSAKNNAIMPKGVQHLKKHNWQGEGRGELWLKNGGRASGRQKINAKDAKGRWQTYI